MHQGGCKLTRVCSCYQENKYAELRDAELKVSTAGKQMQKTLVRYRVDRVAPLRRDFDIDSKALQSIRVGTELTCHAIQTDLQKFRHIKTVVDSGKTGWIPLRGDVLPSTTTTRQHQAAHSTHGMHTHAPATTRWQCGAFESNSGHRLPSVIGWLTSLSWTMLNKC